MDTEGLEYPLQLKASPFRAGMDVNVFSFYLYLFGLYGLWRWGVANHLDRGDG
jgi:hypothetical protein